MEQSWFENFLAAHRPYPQDSLFTWVWHTDCAHDILNGIKMADEPTSRLFQRMKDAGDLEKSVLFFISDHGFRFGSFAKTTMGEMENNLPFFFVRFPVWFEQQFPELVANVRLNARRLITAFDLHKTLQHLLHLQTSTDGVWSNGNGVADAQGRLPQESFSLMTEIPVDRNCERAGIPDAFCGCFALEELDLTPSAGPNEAVAAAHGGAIGIVKTVNSALEGYRDICYVWKMAKLTKVKKKPKEDKFMIRVEVSPEMEKGEAEKLDLNAIFEGWVVKNEDGSYAMKLKEISRLDRYGNTSQCILQRAYHLKEFCRCKSG